MKEIRYIYFCKQANILVSLTFNFVRLVAHQACVTSISDCSRIQSPAEFLQRKILVSSANNRHIEYVITLKSHLEIY